MKFMLILVCISLIHADDYLLASMEGLNISESYSVKETSTTQDISSNEKSSAKTLIEQAVLGSPQQAIQKLNELSSTELAKSPELWLEIGLQKIKSIDLSLPAHLRLAQLNSAHKDFQKALDCNSISNEESQTLRKKIEKIIIQPQQSTWHSKQIDEAFKEQAQSNREKAYEWSLYILFKQARKHQFRSARLNYEIAMQYSRMSQMEQYASRRKEFLKEMNIFLKRAEDLQGKFLSAYPHNDYFSIRSSMLMGIMPNGIIPFFDSNNSLTTKQNSSASPENSTENQSYSSDKAVYVDSSVVSALTANKENRLDWALKNLYEARRDVGKKSAKLSYFIAKQHELLAEASSTEKQRKENLDSAKKMLQEAVEAGKSNIQQHPENKKWAAAASDRLQKKYQNTQSDSTPKPSTSNTGMILPVKGLVTSLYGMRLHPILGVWKKHKGLDIAEYGNPPVKAMANGVVTRSNWFDGYGNGVEIKYDNGYTSFYGHLRDMNGSAGRTRVGMRVKKGQIVGHMGHTGLGAGDHLHLEMDYNGRLIDPVPVISKIAGVAVRHGTEL